MFIRITLIMIILLYLIAIIILLLSAWYISNEVKNVRNNWDKNKYRLKQLHHRTYVFRHRLLQILDKDKSEK